MLVDSHCHLNFPDFSHNLDAVIERARTEYDIGTIQTICTKISEFEEIYSIATRYPFIYCSLGVHPHHAEQEITSTEQLIELGSRDKVIGIGETGLDYFYEHAARDAQKKSFECHIEAARELDMPVIVHTREAEKDTVEIMQRHMGKAPFRGLIHCFTSSQYLADAMLEIGCFISISGIVTFKNAEDLRKTAKTVPLDRLLVETDAPYLAPVPHRGKTNEPGFTKYTAEFLAELRGITYEELAKATTDNFFTLFSLAKRMTHEA